jgi:hypothetical protein
MPTHQVTLNEALTIVVQPLHVGSQTRSLKEINKMYAPRQLGCNNRTHHWQYVRRE